LYIFLNKIIALSAAFLFLFLYCFSFLFTSLLCLQALCLLFFLTSGASSPEWVKPTAEGGGLLVINFLSYLRCFLFVCISVACMVARSEYTVTAQGGGGVIFRYYKN
jgi:hypothetical protein